jgi:hypothetical protein
MWRGIDPNTSVYVILIDNTPGKDNFVGAIIYLLVNMS